MLDTLARLGVRGQRAEMPFGDAASIWVRIDARRQTTLSAYLIESDDASFVVTGTRHVRGVDVEVGDPVTDTGERNRFDCGERRYYVGGWPPPPFVRMGVFIDALIVGLNCAADG